MRKQSNKVLSSVLCAALCVTCFAQKPLSASDSLQQMKNIQIDCSGNYDTSDQTVTAQVTNRSVNTVKEEIFGANTSWISNGYNLWDETRQATDSSLLSKLQKSGVTTLRYPGGIEGDYFHWNETVGQNRVAQVNPFSSHYPTYAETDGERQNPTFGVDEFFRVCAEAGTNASVQLNAGTGTTQEAVDYIHYLQNKGYMNRVNTIGIGNEVCMEEERVQGIKVTKTPQEYISFCNGFFQKLGTSLSNSNTPIGVVGITPSHPLCKYAAWDSSVISALKDKIDFIDVHIGYSYYFESLNNADDSVRCFLASANWIANLIEEEKQIINNYAGSYADDISIQISELGPVGGNYPNSVAGSLFLADLFNVILRESKVSATDYLPLLNHYDAAQLLGAKTDTEEKCYWDNAVSHVFRMYASLVGNDVLRTDVSGGKRFNSVACGLVPAIKDVPTGTVQTYLDPETGKGSVFILNKSLNENQNYEINLPFSATVEKVTELWDEDPTAANAFYRQRKVSLKQSTDAKGKNGNSLTVCTKPVSLVRVEFRLNTQESDTSFQDEFSTDSIEKYQVAGPDNGAWGSWHIADGKLCVTGNSGAQWWGTSAVLSNRTFGDFIMEFDADVLSGYGVILRAQDDGTTKNSGLNSWYGGNGYAILHWVPVERNANIEIFDYNGAAVKLAEAGNLSAMQSAHWCITAIGDEISITVEDKADPQNRLSYQLKDSRYSSGSIAFYNLTYGGVDSLKIDNLSITPLGTQMTYVSPQKQNITPDQTLGTWENTENRITGRVEQGVGYAWFDRLPLADVDVSFEVLVSSEGTQYGLVFSADEPFDTVDGGNAYTVLYDGNWVFAGKLNGTFQQLTQTDTRYAYCPSEHGVLPVKWRIRYQNGLISVFINEQAIPAITVKATSGTYGFVGLRMLSPEKPGTLAIQNLKIGGVALRDTNADGQIDIKDIIRLKKYLINNNVPFAAAALAHCKSQPANGLTDLRQYLLGYLQR